MTAVQLPSEETATPVLQSKQTNGVSPETNGVNGTETQSSDDKDTNGVTAGATSSEIESANTTEAKTDESTKTGDEAAKPEKPQPQQCKVRPYEARYDGNGSRELVALDADKADGAEADSADDKRKYAICSYKYYQQNGQLESASIEIMSSHIISALQEVINEYPGDHYFSESVTIDSPYKSVFHYREKLAAHATKLESEEAKEHVQLLLSFCHKEHRRDIQEYDTNVKNATNTPSIRWKNLWMVYKPGELIFSGRGPSLKCMEIIDSFEQGGCSPAWIIQAKSFTHNGTHFGYEESLNAQSPYKGMKALTKLQYVPEDHFEDAELAKVALLQRGEKFCSLRGSHYRTYAGTVMSLSDVRDWNSMGEWKEEPMVIASRIMVDANMFGVMKSSNAINIGEVKAMPKDCTPEEEKEYITERDLITADYRMPGYALQIKRWCWFSVDHIAPVVFNTEAFGSLLIPQRKKTLVQGLVKSHASGTDEFDDLIAGKGKGLVFVLHGCPGVGKTFTAESVADHIERPLYILNSGELGIQPELVEENLNRALMLAVAWNAILLIDEADVFLEQRSTSDLQRNCLVSLFLRTLEYFEGILFLTTNRVTTFDPAFKSRVHLALKYNALTAETRKELWSVFIARTSKDAPVFDNDTLERLAAVEVNGRQIKNAVRTANSLAKHEGVPLNEEHLLSVLDTIAEFERDLANPDEWSE